MESTSKMDTWRNNSEGVKYPFAVLIYNQDLELRIADDYSTDTLG